MPIGLTAKIEPKNNGFVGMVDADQIIGASGAGGYLPSSTISGNSLQEYQLKISNNPSDGYFLQYKDSTDKMTWAEASAMDVAWSGASGYVGHSGNRDIHFPSSQLLDWLNGEYSQSGATGGISSWYDLSAGTGITPFGGSVSISGTQAESVSVLGYSTISSNAKKAQASAQIALYSETYSSEGDLTSALDDNYHPSGYVISGSEYSQAYASAQRVKDLFDHTKYSISTNLYNKDWIDTLSGSIDTRLDSLESQEPSSWSGATDFYGFSSNVKSDITSLFNTSSAHDSRLDTLEGYDQFDHTLYQTSTSAILRYADSSNYSTHKNDSDIHFPSSSITPWLDGVYQQSGETGFDSSWSGASGYITVSGLVNTLDSWYDSSSSKYSNAYASASIALYEETYSNESDLTSVLNDNYAGSGAFLSHRDDGDIHYPSSSILTWLNTVYEPLGASGTSWSGASGYIGHSSNTDIHYTKTSIELGNLGNVSVPAPTSGNSLIWNGSSWVDGVVSGQTSISNTANYQAGWALVSTQSKITHNFGTTPQIVGITPSGGEMFGYSVSYDNQFITVYLSVEGKHCVNWFAGGPNSEDLDFYVNPQNVQISKNDSNRLYFSGQNGTYVYSGANTIIISSSTGGASTIEDLTDVAEMTPADGEALIWVDTQSKWSSQTVSTSDVAWSGASEFYAVSSLVNSNTLHSSNSSIHLTGISSPLSGQIPVYGADQSNATWQNVYPPMTYSIPNTFIASNQKWIMGKFSTPSDKSAYVIQSYCGNEDGESIGDLSVQMLSGTTIKFSNSSNILQQYSNPSSSKGNLEFRLVYSGASNPSDTQYANCLIQIGVW